MNLNRHLARAVVLAALGALGCGSDSEPSGGTPDAGQVTGMRSKYVNSQLKVGMDLAEAQSYAWLDLDGKGDQTDNKLGEFLANLNEQFMLDNALATATNQGTIVILHSIQADSLVNDSDATWQVWLGSAQPNPVFDGTGTFTVASNAPADAILTGSIAGGVFNGEADRITIELALSQELPPLRLEVNTANIRATVTPNGITNARLAGAIASTELDQNVVPALTDFLDARIGADAGCRANPADCEESNQLILTAFDNAPKNGIIEESEVRTILAIVLQPDVDVLLNATGQPGQDNMLDSVSIVLAFGGVKASFTAPNE
jgi:hypothetical protein